ncbi:DUF1707 domain-containing protein [Actinomadura harenae]|uniref:DUF1707 and DUF2154 domain-containing protein n=1 Tax=Actinomadura harenae TaxID=2483351 RepID=A0A3M2LWL4_9ACTN|nr:DUF1707 domain-containing protein [Actinomadura harenae]RMI41602.1 DUF1707 and DUF2154 domain-containing protein [Actinomadura harenae]
MTETPEPPVPAARPDTPEARPDILASDDDRTRAEVRVRAAVESGRLALDELGPRLDEVFRARTRGDLESACRGLPEPGPRDALVVDRAPTSRSFLVGIFGGFERTGEWVVPPKMTLWTMWGGGVLDFSEARFSSQETQIRSFSIWGGTRMVFPDDVEVDVKGLGLFGVFDKSATRRIGKAGTPRVAVRGLALFGAIVTRTKALRRRPRD